jgi:hypothetical protein
MHLKGKIASVSKSDQGGITSSGYRSDQPSQHRGRFHGKPQSFTFVRQLAPRWAIP